MSKSKAFLFSMVLALIAPAAFAGGSWSSVTVVQISPITPAYAGGNGEVEVHLSANSTGGPTCGSGNKAWVVIDVTSAAGAYAAAVMQSARLSGTTITVTGAGTCAVVGTIETLAYVSE